MATYVLQGPPHQGAQLSYVTPASGDLAATGPGYALLVKSPSAAITVSMPVPSLDGLTVSPRVISVGSGQDWLIPVPDSIHGGGTIPVTYTGTLTAVLVALVRVP